MRLTRSLFTKSLGVIVPGFALLGLTGCSLLEINSFVDPGEPHIVLEKDSKPLVVPILDTLDRGVEEPDNSYSNATDIRPEDLIPDVSDYRMGKNDLVNISIFDLLGEGTGETVKTARISESGFVSLPFISPVKAEGLTEQELQDAIVKAYQDAKLIRNARVSVTVAEARARTFSIQGNAGAPGEYQITRPDFRMLDALVVGRAPATAQGVDYAYVIRNLDMAKPAAPAATPDMGTPPATTAPTSQPSDLLEPHTQNDTVGPNHRVVLASSTDAPPPAASTQHDLLAPGSDSAPTGVIDNHAAPAPAAAPDASQGAAAPTPAAPFKFNDLEAPSDVRIIRVPIDELRQGGQLKYNIVIRPGDMIIIPDPVTGEYYMGGHVQRTGVYSLTARNITLKEAWVSAGGADQQAIPGRTEIIRRIGPNKEVFVRVDLDKVWSGMQPDIFLKPNDIVQVGTDFFAPFLSAVRNSFRLTYGFGFLYDRNFFTGTGSQSI